jgi:hypothetical protein
MKALSSSARIEEWMAIMIMVACLIELECFIVTLSVSRWITYRSAKSGLDLLRNRARQERWAVVGPLAETTDQLIKKS